LGLSDDQCGLVDGFFKRKAIKGLFNTPTKEYGRAAAHTMDCRFARSPGGDARLVELCLNIVKKTPNANIKSLAVSGPFLVCYNAAKDEISKMCSDK